MKTLGILLCDDHRDEMIPQFGTYDRDFLLMLDSVNAPDFSYHVWRCHEDQFPESSAAADAWLLSGSKWGAYDPDPWIGRLKQLIREIADTGACMAGICFGHQVIHSALGGEVIKSPRGWGLGPYPVVATTEFGDFSSDQAIRVLAMHQDQVVQMAPGFDLLAGSDFCPHAITRKGSQILTTQSHPEFVDELFRELCDKIVDKAGAELVNCALREMQEGDDRLRLRQLITEHLLSEQAGSGCA